MASIDIDLLIQTSKAANSLKDVRTQAKAIKAAMLQIGDEGSADFNRLAQAAAQLDDRMGEVNDRIKAFNPDGFAALSNFAGKAAAAVSAVTGAMALFGSENEDVQKSLMKVQAAMALAQGLEGMSGMSDAVKDLKAGLKDLWKSMLANPVLAIVSVLAILATTAYAVYKAFTEVSDETKELNKQYEKQKVLTAGLSREYERQIDLLTAQGASEAEVIEVKKKMIEAQILEAETGIRLHASKIKDIEDNDSLYESYLRVQSSVSGFLGFTEAEQVQLDLVAKNKAERAEEEIKGAKEDLETLKDLRNQLLVIDAEVETKTRETNANIAKERKSENDKRAADHAALMDQILIDEIALGDQLIAAQEEINAAIDEAEKRKAQKHREYISEKHRREQEAHDKQKALNEAAAKRDEMIAKARLDAVAGLFGSLSQLAGKNQKLMKGFSVAEATINTYRGVTAALADPLLPFPIKLINAATVLASGLANVKKILSVEPSSGGGGGGASGGGSLGGFGGVSAINNAPSQPQVPQPSTQLNPDGSVQGQNQPIRVYVLESDITATQNTVAVAQSAVSFR